MKYNIYLAASFAYPDKDESEKRKAMITKVATLFRMAGHNVFVPHEHAIPNAWGMPNAHWGAAVYGMDVTAIQDSDIVILLSWGKMNTSAGALWEAGFAVGIGKKLITVCMTENLESMMVINSSHAVLYGIDGIVMYDWDKMPVVRQIENEVN